jgi:hypothetical protein
LLSRLASTTGFFRIVEGCLSFTDEAGQSASPVFGRGPGSPVAGPDGLIWGGRKIRYGEEVRLGGSSAPRDLEIDEVARRGCPGPFVAIYGFPPRNAEELEAMLAQRKAPGTAPPGPK